MSRPLDGRRGRALGLTAVLLAPALALGACLGPGVDGPYKALRPEPVLELEAVGPGLATRVRVGLRLHAPADGPVTVVGRRPAGRPGDDALLDLSVRRQDFPGTGPVAHGRTLQQALPFGTDGVAAPGAPLRRDFLVDLDPPREALARRVHVTGRLYTVDVFDGEGHAGSVVLELPMTSVETLVRRPTVPLSVALRTARAEEVFLAAAATPRGQRERAVDELVRALSTTEGAVRESVLAALLFLTGETLGRSEYRWQEWWRARRGQGEGDP